MKVLWLCNIPLPAIAQDCNLPIPNGGGWLVGLSNDLLGSNKVELTVCFPVDGRTNLLEGKVGELSYYGFPRQTSDPTKYDVSIGPYLKEITDKVKPDLVHIWGTEFPHSLAMTKAFPYPNNTVINIQGLCSIYSTHYYANLPYKVIRAITFRDFIRQDNIIQQRKKFEKRGQYELQALRNVNHVIGRTNWDRACTYQANPNALYHFCNETLRGEFYTHQWDINQCERHSILLSQGNYPIKGLHLVLEAMPQILKRYPDTHLYIAGSNITKCDTIKDKLKLSSYAKYIRDLIRKYELSKYITFLGSLDEKQMCAQYLKANVFLSASSIENSPNSLGEAMLLGVPCVSSDVGGVTDMMVHQKEGFVYPADEYYMISYYVSQLFSNETLALQFSENAKAHANITHNRVYNLNQILKIYKEICDGNLKIVVESEENK